MDSRIVERLDLARQDRSKSNAAPCGPPIVIHCRSAGVAAFAGVTRSACRHGLVLAAIHMVFLLETSCAPKRSYTPAPVRGWECVSDVFQRPPADLPARDQDLFEQAWGALVEGDLEQAAKALERLVRRHRDNAAVRTALGYLDLRSGDPNGAEDRFRSVLDRSPSMEPAQAGMVLVALTEGKEELALDRLRELSTLHPQHEMVREYLPMLQLKLAESKLQAARSYRRQGRYEEAAEMYRQALRIAPEAGGLYAEAAEVELLGEEPEEAAAHAARALELEPGNAVLYRLRGDALRAMGDLEGAIEAYEKAEDLRREDASLSALIDETRRELQRQILPPEFQEIPETERITREELAALLYVKLRPLLERTGSRVRVIATDISDSWAREFIRLIVGAGIMDVYPNHTFQPNAFLSKRELAAALVSAWDIFAENEGTDSVPDVVISDVSPQNLNYRSAAVAVALGLVSTDAEGRFQPLEFVSGRQAIDAVDALARRLVP